MAIKDFLNNVKYPTMDQRVDIFTNYFNTTNLHLDIDAYLKLNNLSKKITTDFFDSEGLFYTVNQDLREKVRRFNNDVFYLTDAIFRMVNYYNLMKDSTTEDDRIIYEVLFRRSARCVCAEIFMYEEKIKNMIRLILQFNSSTRKHDIFMYHLKQQAKSNQLVRKFRKTYIEYLNNEDVKFVKQIRHDEIHNDSPIEEYTDVQPFAPGVISYCEIYHVISNDQLFNSLKEVLNKQKELKDSLQSILDNHKI